MSVLLVGFETASLQGEKSLYEISSWAVQNPTLARYITETPAKKIASDLNAFLSPEHIISEVWCERNIMIERHLTKYSSTCYEYDFGVPTPREEPQPMIESIKTFVSGEGKNPFDRQAQAVEKREKATENMLNHLGGLRKKLFKRLLRWEQETGAMRENAIYHMGMAHPLIRQMLGGIASRLVRDGGIIQTEDIYFLEKQELELLVQKATEGQLAS